MGTLFALMDVHKAVIENAFAPYMFWYDTMTEFWSKQIQQ